MRPLLTFPSKRFAASLSVLVSVLAFYLAPSAAQAAEGAPSAPLPPVPAIPSVAGAAPLDPIAATRAYLDTVPAAAHARSDAYFEGGYWLILIGFVVSTAIALLLLQSGFSARLRDFARRLTRVRFLQVAIYGLGYLLATTLLGFPLTLYTDFFREHTYGLSTMTFGGWMGDQAKGLAVGAIAIAVFLPILYAVLARAKGTWWLWGALVTIAFGAFVSAVVPVFVSPLFNHYEPVANQAVRSPVLALARANGIPATEVWQFDASRQSNRVSANVSGLFGTERISLNDNLLKRCSLPEIEAVMGHEMGHYVLHHVTKGLMEMGILFVLAFVFVRFFFDRLRAQFAARWKVEGVDDPAGLPLLVALFGVYAFLLTPVFNTLVRTQEAEADIFGLNAARQPDGAALVALKLGDYRKLDPGPLEEIFFFDHPSGRARISMAMQWKAEHLAEPAANASLR
ncbi:MAG TPA: M48 family metallopeptidase [Polyangiaceae bacterium]